MQLHSRGCVAVYCLSDNGRMPAARKSDVPHGILDVCLRPRSKIWMYWTLFADVNTAVWALSKTLPACKTILLQNTLYANQGGPVNRSLNDVCVCILWCRFWNFSWSHSCMWAIDSALFFSCKIYTPCPNKKRHWFCHLSSGYNNVLKRIDGSFLLGHLVEHSSFVAVRNFTDVYMLSFAVVYFTVSLIYVCICTNYFFLQMVFYIYR